MRTLMQLELEKKAFQSESPGGPSGSGDQGNHVGDGALSGYFTAVCDSGGFAACPRDSPDGSVHELPDDRRQDAVVTPVLDFHCAGDGVNGEQVMEYVVEDSVGSTDSSGGGIKMSEAVRFDDVASKVFETADKNRQDGNSAPPLGRRHPHDDDFIQISEDSADGKSTFETADLDEHAGIDRKMSSIDELVSKENVDHGDEEAGGRGIGVGSGPTDPDLVGVGSEMQVERPSLSS